MGIGPPGSPKQLGDYEIVQWIATGGMAEVYVARRRGARGFVKTVALKRILPQFASDTEFVSMFIDEARICSALSHPNLVEVFDFGEQGGELFMAMELVEGTTCARLVRAAAARNEPVPVEDALFLVLNILRGLEYAHDAEDDQGRPLNLVHRDVSPGNMLVSRAGAVKLTDFGIVRAAHVERRTESGQLKGKLGYMSPEQVTGRELDRRSDLFTLGIVLAELLTGRPLFSHGPELDILFRIRDADLSVFRRYGASLAPELQTVVHRALARDPAERFQSATAFAEAIETFVRQQRLTLGPMRLGAYIEALGLVRPTSRSGEFRLRGVLDSTPRAKPMRLPSKVASPPSEPHPTTYVLRLSDGSTQGPMSLARVLEGLLTTRIPHDVEVSRDGGPFMPTRSFPELRRMASLSSHRWDVTVTSRGGEHLNFDERSLPMLLFRLATSAQNALVVIHHGAERKKLHLREGMLVQIASTDPNELLGERLLRSGRILPVELDMALALAPRHGGRVGDALVGLGILRPFELFQAVYDQAQERAAAMLAWRRGEAWLFPGELGSEEDLPRGLPLFEVVAQGVLEHRSEQELDSLLSPHRTPPLRLGPRDALNPLALRLPPGLHRALMMTDGQLSLDDLLARAVDNTAMSRSDVLRGVFLGLCCGALSVEGWPELPAMS